MKTALSLTHRHTKTYRETGANQRDTNSETAWEGETARVIPAARNKPVR